MPPVSAPSPTTATTSLPVATNPSAMPHAQDRAVDAWEFSMTSWSDRGGW